MQRKQIKEVNMVHKVSDIDEFNRYFHQPTDHPFVSVADLARADYSLFELQDFDMYCIVLMDSHFGELKKNGQVISYDAGTLFSIKPGEEVCVSLNHTVRPEGKMLAFRKELIQKCGLGRDFYMFDFFNHDVRNALILSQSERGIILNSISNIYAELMTPTDYLTDHMIRLGIGQLLSYYKRFFERQYADHVVKDSNLRARLEQLLTHYLSSGSSSQHGVPTVAWCAEQFNLSPNYFGDLAKKELGIPVKDFIHEKILFFAKHLLSTTDMSVNDIAEELGFTYSNHFTRMFRNATGMSPLQFRNHRQR